MEKKNVMIFVTGGVGGAERVTLTITKLLDTTRYNVKLVVTDSATCHLSQFIPENIPCKYLNEPHFRFSTFGKILKSIKQERPDFVFASISPLCILLVLCCRLFCHSVKVIIRGQINPSHWDMNDLIPKMAKYTYRHAYKVVAQTPMMRQEMIDILGINAEKVIQLYNPIDTKTIDAKIKEESPFVNVDGFKYVAVGRCAHQKGYDLLIKAFNRVVQERPNSHLYIVGGDSGDEYCSGLHALTQEYMLGDRVHFEGFSSNPYKYIYNSDCYVLSSRDEGLPNVLIESTYLHKQAVAYTCIPIITEIIQNGINGICIEPESIEGLADAMIKIQSLNLNVASTYKPSSSNSFNKLFS